MSKIYVRSLKRVHAALHRGRARARVWKWGYARITRRLCRNCIPCAVGYGEWIMRRMFRYKLSLVTLQTSVATAVSIGVVLASALPWRRQVRW